MSIVGVFRAFGKKRSPPIARHVANNAPDNSCFPLALTRASVSREAGEDRRGRNFVSQEGYSSPLLPSGDAHVSVLLPF